MTDYKIENTDINDEENFRAWERLVMDYEPVRRNLYEVYCKSLKNGCKKATKPEPKYFPNGMPTGYIPSPHASPRPEPKPIVKPTLTINTSFLNRQLQELESDGDNFSSDEEVEINDIVEIPSDIVEIPSEIVEIPDIPYRIDPTTKLNLQFFQLEIPKMDVVIKLFHKNSAKKHVSFTTDSSEFSQNIVIQKDKEFWINIIDAHSNISLVGAFQFNKKQKEIFLAAYPYDKKRLPPMFITHIKD